MSEARISSFEEFWPYYLREHSKPVTKWFHWFGTNIALSVVAIAVTTSRPWMILLALLPGYGFAWISHFFLEKNRPATFKYPLWSLLGDFKMWSLMWVGKLGPHVERAG